MIKGFGDDSLGLEIITNNDDDKDDEGEESVKLEKLMMNFSKGLSLLYLCIVDF